MPGKKQDDSQVISVRLPHALVRRLDRYLDWSEFYRRVKSSRNAAMRDALSTWLDHQEQLAGLIEPQAQPHYNRRSQPRILGKRLIADAIGPV